MWRWSDDVRERIAGYFPEQFGTYYEPFLGSGAVLSTLSPNRAIGSDAFGPLMDIWDTLSASPDLLKEWYRVRWQMAEEIGKVEAYNQIRTSFNLAPNGADLAFLARACYGGVVRFRKRDGHMSTPCGAHQPIRPESFDSRVDLWHERIRGAVFKRWDYRDAFSHAQAGDLIYCDPPYVDSQAILYGAQNFRLPDLFSAIEACTSRGVKVVLSIDGTKRSGDHICDVQIPDGLFAREATVNVGRSMLRRFQMQGESLDGHVVRDRLLLNY